VAGPAGGAHTGWDERRADGGASGCDSTHDALMGGDGRGLKGGDGRSQGNQSDAEGSQSDGDGAGVEDWRGHHVRRRVSVERALELGFGPKSNRAEGSARLKERITPEGASWAEGARHTDAETDRGWTKTKGAVLSSMGADPVVPRPGSNGSVAAEVGRRRRSLEPRSRRSIELTGRRSGAEDDKAERVGCSRIGGWRHARRELLDEVAACGLDLDEAAMRGFGDVAGP
jgi:hypothetical protein